MALSKAVYLNTNYWIQLRDAERGKGSASGLALLNRLRTLVAARKIICIGHLTSMLEIAKQLEGSARVSTALVDELIERVALTGTQAIHSNVAHLAALAEIIRIRPVRGGQVLTQRHVKPQGMRYILHWSQMKSQGKQR